MRLWLTLLLLTSSPTGTVQAQTLALGARRCDLAAGAVRCEEDDRDNSREVELPHPVVTLSATGNRACVLDAAGSVWCWSLDDDDDDFLAPHEITALRGRSRAVEVGDGFVCALLTEGTASCWGAARSALGRGDTGVDATLASIDDPTVLVRSETGALGGLVSLFVSGAQAAALDEAGSLHVWSEGAGYATPRALSIRPTALRCNGSGCCVHDGAGGLECWGGLETMVAPLVRDLPDWRDVVLVDHGACVASETRVECDGDLRPERDGARWSAFEVRHVRILGLVTSGEVTCAVTTGAPRCWWRGEAPEHVVPIVAASHWRLAPGERLLRTRVEPVACAEDADADDESTTMSATGSRRRVRVTVRGLVENCARDPRIEAQLREDGTVELGVADWLWSEPVTACECAFDLDVIVRGVPEGEHAVVLEPEGRRPELRAHVIVE